MNRFAVMLVLLMVLPGWGVTYYVATDGADTNNGTSAATPFAHHPWATNATGTADATVLVAGDTVVFKRGQTWYGCYLVVGTSGSDGEPITTTSQDGFGTGANPVLSCGYDPSTLSWSADGGSYKVTGITTSPSNVIYNGTWLTANNGATNTVGANEWDWDDDSGSKSLWVNVGGDPSSGTVLIPQLARVLYVGSKSYTSISNLTLNGAGGQSSTETVLVSASTHCNINNCAIQYGLQGVEIYNGDDCTVASCIFTENVSPVIYVRNGSDRVTVAHCDVTGRGVSSTERGIVYDSSNDGSIYGCSIRNVWNQAHYPTGDGCAILLSGSSQGNSIYSNLVEDNYLGIWCSQQSGAGGDRIFANMVVRSRVNGIDIQSVVTTPEYVYNNTVWHEPGDHDATAGVDYTGHGIDIQGAGLRADFRNNLIYLNRWGDGATNCQALCIAGDFVDVTSDNNLLYCPNAAGHLGKVGAVNYDTLDSWKAAVAAAANVTGDEAHSLSADPLFLSPSTGDFRLKKGSPCINAGTNLGASYDDDYLGYDQDVYGSGWEIGAYVYRPKFIIAR